MKVFISQPMRGKDPETIKAERAELIERTAERLGTSDFEVVESYFEDYDPEKQDTDVNVPLCFLGESLKLLATAHLAVFAPGWSEARGCRIENICAKEYGITVIEF